MNVRRMTEDDLSRVVKLHEMTLPCTVSSKIGLIYLNHLYKKLVSTGDLHYCLVVLEDGEITGALTATRDLAKTEKILGITQSFHLVPTIILALLKRKISPGELVTRFLFELNVLKQFPAPYATILTLFVKLGNQKKGVGKKLVETCITGFRKKRVTELFVDTLTTNTASKSFYEKMGFDKRAEIGDSFVFSLKN